MTMENQSTLLVIAEYAVGLIVAFLIIKFVVLPAIRKSDKDVGGPGGGYGSGGGGRDPDGGNVRDL